VLAQGAKRPLVREPYFANHVHGANGLGGSRTGTDPASRLLALSKREAKDEIAHQALISSEPLTVVTLGPLTNIALALEDCPELADRLTEIVMMGGAYLGPGNITPAAEFNIFTDPEAADRVFRSKIPVTAVGLDVTRQVRLDRDTLDTWVQESNSSARQKIREWTVHSLSYMQKLDGRASIFLHDPLAVIATVAPGLITTEPMHVEVETKGKLTQGMTLADRRPILDIWKEAPNVRVCTQVDSNQSLKRFLQGIP
jgi:inosine-uridine nucleoside N-ribohydrolase